MTYVVASPETYLIAKFTLEFGFKVNTVQQFDTLLKKADLPVQVGFYQ